MVNAHVRTRRYAPAMRDLPGDPFLRRVREQGAPDQMRRLADVAIASVVLAITLPLMMLVALAIKWEALVLFWIGTLASDAAAGVFKC
jgi:lipopolysaccharide/colanic/teichoic acid biosynthesis glycosyltransferase